MQSIVLKTLFLITVFLIEVDGANTTQNAYDFVFGFSTGHCGTTTLNTDAVYKHKKRKVLIKHEFLFIEPEDWSKWKFEDEYDYVKNKYVPTILKKKTEENASTFMDLGHHNLYFVDALITYLMAETKYTFVFVRIRRERYSLAISLSNKNPSHKYKDICELRTRFCPKQRKSDVIIAVKDKDWEKLTIFQQALWLQDEVEERWQRIIDQFPSLPRIYIFWDNEEVNSFNEAIYVVSRLIQAEPISDEHILQENHKRVHAGSKTASDRIAQHEIEYLELDREYKNNVRKGQGYYSETIIY